MRPRVRREPKPEERPTRTNDLCDGLRRDLGFGNAWHSGFHGGIDRSSTDFAGCAEQVELRRALDQAQLRGKVVGFDQAVLGETSTELASTLAWVPTYQAGCLW